MLLVHYQPTVTDAEASEFQLDFKYETYVPRHIHLVCTLQPSLRQKPFICTKNSQPVRRKKNHLNGFI